jgi:hypothetical protein
MSDFFNKYFFLLALLTTCSRFVFLMQETEGDVAMSLGMTVGIFVFLFLPMYTFGYLVVLGLRRIKKAVKGSPKQEVPIIISSWESSFNASNAGGSIALKNISDKDLTVTVVVVLNTQDPDTREFDAIIPAQKCKEYFGAELNCSFRLGEVIFIHHADYTTKKINLAR